MGRPSPAPRQRIGRAPGSLESSSNGASIPSIEGEGKAVLLATGGGCSDGRRGRRPLGCGGESSGPMAGRNPASCALATSPRWPSSPPAHSRPFPSAGPWPSHLSGGAAW